MQLNKQSGLEVYETTEELIEKGITASWKYSDKYYVLVETEDNYDNRIWIIDADTKKLSNPNWMAFTSFFEFIDEATEINPEELTKVLL